MTQDTVSVRSDILFLLCIFLGDFGIFTFLAKNLPFVRDEVGLDGLQKRFVPMGGGMKQQQLAWLRQAESSARTIEKTGANPRHSHDISPAAWSSDLPLSDS